MTFMYQRVTLSKVMMGIALSMSASAFAADAIELNKASFATIKNQFSINPKALSGTQTKDHLQFVKQHTDLNQVSHVRMQQMYAGVPVMGGYAIMHTKNESKLHGMSLLVTAKDNSVKMTGKVFQGLESELLKPTAELKSNAAVALEKAKKAFQDKKLSEEASTLIVYLDDNNKAHWAYRVSFVVNHDSKIPERPIQIIDAKTMDVLLKWNDMKTIRSNVYGLGFGGNKRTGEYQFGKDHEKLELTRDDAQKLCYMENDDIKVVDMEHNYYSSNKPMKFDCGDEALITGSTYWTGYNADGYDRENGAFSPTNDAMYAGYVIKHMYNDWYGLQVLTDSDGSPMQLVMRVHYGSSYQNAFWDGRQMTFGDGGYMMYPLVSLGVGAHEISHGFTEQHSGLEYYGQSGGMNESFSDMAAQAAEYYSDGESSWMIGERIMKDSVKYPALRFMDKPSKDGRSIDTADDYYSGLDVHYSSGVYNRLYYLMSNLPGWNARKTFDVMVKANMDYWTPYATFKSGACGVLSATKDFGYDVAGVKETLDKVTIDYSSCS
jgi:pseudolysin